MQRNSLLTHTLSTGDSWKLLNFKLTWRRLVTPCPVQYWKSYSRMWRSLRRKPESACMGAKQWSQKVKWPLRVKVWADCTQLTSWWWMFRATNLPFLVDEMHRLFKCLTIYGNKTNTVEETTPNSYKLPALGYSKPLLQCFQTRTRETSWESNAHRLGSIRYIHSSGKIRQSIRNWKGSVKKEL